MGVIVDTMGLDTTISLFKVDGNGGLCTESAAGTHPLRTIINIKFMKINMVAAFVFIIFSLISSR
jgi:hypothetical protein